MQQSERMQHEHMQRGRHAMARVVTAAFGCVAAALAVTAVPGAANADTVYTYELVPNSIVAGSATGSPSAFCAVGNACPSTPAFSLGANVPLTGSISVDATTSTMTFDLTLAQNAAFGSLTVLQGSTFIAPASSPIGVSITTKTSQGVTTATVLPGSTASVISANLLLGAGFTQTEGQPILSGLDCSVIVGGSGSCAFLLGTPVNGANALQVASSGADYNGVLSISANLVPVPLPPSLWLMLAGLGWLYFYARVSPKPAFAARCAPSSRVTTR